MAAKYSLGPPHVDFNTSLWVPFCQQCRFLVTCFLKLKHSYRAMRPSQWISESAPFFQNSWLQSRWSYQLDSDLTNYFTSWAKLLLVIMRFLNTFFPEQLVSLFWPCFFGLTNSGYLGQLVCFGPGVSTFPQTRPWLEMTLCYNDNSFDLQVFFNYARQMGSYVSLGHTL